MICGPRKMVQDKMHFNHTKSQFSKKFARLGWEDFVAKVMEEKKKLNITSQSQSQMGSSSSSGQSSRTSAPYHFSDSSSNDPNESSSAEEQEESRSELEIGVDSIPRPLRSSKEITKTEEDEIRKAITDAEIDGVLRVNTCKLEAGQEYLRETSSLWKDHIKQSMKENPFVKGAPLVAVVDVAKADFDKNRPNAYSYTVIGGCHQLAAVKELRQENPTIQKYAVRDIQIYGKELLDHATATSWLANEHNHVQAMHMKMTTEAKVKYCRKKFLERNITTPEIWKQNCRVILRLKKADNDKFIVDLATLDESVYDQVLMIFSAYKDAEIKGAKLSAEELQCGGDLKAYNFKEFLQIKDSDCQVQLLQELLDGSMTLKEFKVECRAVVKRRARQLQFIKELNLRNWEQAEAQYPLHTTAVAMDRFEGVNFKKALPDVWRDHIISAKKYKEGTETELPPQCYKGDNDVCGYIVRRDIKCLTKDVIKKYYPAFNGADLVMMNVKHEEINTFSIEDIVSLNCDSYKNSFMIVVFTDVFDVSKVAEALKRGKCLHVEIAYTNTTPGKILGGKGLLHSSVRPFVVGYWSAGTTMPSPITSLVKRKADQSNLFTAGNEVDLLKEISEIFTSINQWILAFNLDNDVAAVTASLDSGRNCIQLVPTDMRANAAHRELNKRQLKHDEENRESSDAALISGTSNHGENETDSSSQNTQVHGFENGEDRQQSVIQDAQASMTQEEDDRETVDERQEQEAVDEQQAMEEN